MKSEDNLWDTGKDDDAASPASDDNSTLDLSEISPEKNDEEINLELPKEIEEKDEDWAIPIAEDVEGLNLKAIGVVGTVVILLLTGTIFVLLNETQGDKIMNITKDRMMASELIAELQRKIEQHGDQPVEISVDSNRQTFVPRRRPHCKSTLSVARTLRQFESG